MSIIVKVKRIKKEAFYPKKISVGDWVDLCTCKEITLKAGDIAYIPLGIAMEFPKEYEAIVAPRSSTCKRYGVLQANSIGVIDHTYCGDNDEWHFPVYATQDTVIPYGTRICQFRLLKRQPVIQFVPVDSLGNTDRGGLGSTGL